MKALFSFCVVVFALGLSSFASAQGVPCGDDMPCGGAYYQREPSRPSWIFAPSTYTHDPYTGARVAQYMRPAPVEPLDDPRIVTSRYRRVRTNLRGSDGSFDSTYDVQNWGNGRGGLDAEWQNFHDAWKESFLTGGFYNQQNPGFGNFPHAGFGNGFPSNGYGAPNNFPQPGYGGPMPGYGYPGQGYPQGPGMFPQNGPHNSNGPWNGRGPHGGGKKGGGADQKGDKD